MKVFKILERVMSDIKDFWPALCVFVLYNIIVRLIFHAFCPFLIFTGFPCAGCGLTRAVFYILTGRIARGMALNPSAPIWIAFIACFLFKRYIQGKTFRHMELAIGIAAMITLTIYIYRMVNFFPGNPPLVFYKNNILSRTAKLCKLYMQNMN